MLCPIGLLDVISVDTWALSGVNLIVGQTGIKVSQMWYLTPWGDSCRKQCFPHTFFNSSHSKLKKSAQGTGMDCIICDRAVFGWNKDVWIYWVWHRTQQLALTVSVSCRLFPSINLNSILFQQCYYLFYLPFCCTWQRNDAFWWIFTYLYCFPSSSF